MRIKYKSLIFNVLYSLFAIVIIPYVFYQIIHHLPIDLLIEL
jgi:hypothetical protein